MEGTRQLSETRPLHQNPVRRHQWMFFILTNTVVVPLTLGQAFSPAAGANSRFRANVLRPDRSGLRPASLDGHRYALMEGPSGVWWGLTLSLAATAGRLRRTRAGGAAADLRQATCCRRC
ncbi:hypothetical protein D3H35_03520 [Cohnella faecalis]|uniref:Uncharacterized protein n=1 Tax=Cohnella faecalis TaxID=2315694 RepID=A0A398CRU9_9BACL|nr:hypothetical protein D3H35_03520 [Cohnella faecalis]